jgi:hypothetical protein
MRIGTTTAGWAFAAAVLAAAVSSSGPVKAQPATQIAQEVSQPATDLSAQRRRAERPPTRLRIHPRPDDGYDVYPRYNPGPNAVRDCTATYVQEFRPSGTVIVPRMHCFWRRG